MAKITKRFVDAVRPGSKDYIIWDDHLKGFGLRVTPAGAKSYLVQYRAGRGRNAPSRRITIGKHGSPWTPETARKEAIHLLGEVARGSDPVQARKAEAGSMSIAELCDLYLTEGVGHKKPSTIKNDRGRIEHHIKPLIGRLRTDKMTRTDVERMMRDVSAGRTAEPEPKERRPGAVVRGGRGTAAQAVAALGAVITFAITRGLRNDNPVAGVKKPPSRKMERFLSEVEIARLAEVLEGQIASAGDPYPAAAIKLLLFTGCRRGEIMTLRWIDVDFERALLLLPDSKTGRKVVYLNAPALAVLADLPRQEGNPYVICGHREGAPYIGLDKVWQRVRMAARLPGVRLHDLRHSFASVGVGAGMGLPVVGKLLGHANAVTTQRYAHLADDPVRRAVEGIGEWIAAAMAKKTTAEDAVGEHSPGLTMKMWRSRRKSARRKPAAAPGDNSGGTYVILDASAPIEWALQRNKGGRPSVKRRICATLDRLKGEGCLVLEMETKPLANLVAKECGTRIGAPGWSLRTVRDHVKTWCKEDQS